MQERRAWRGRPETAPDRGESFDATSISKFAVPRWIRRRQFHAAHCVAEFVALDGSGHRIDVD